MTTTKKGIPPIVKIGAWLLSFIAFIVGFWHAHLGLKSFYLFNSEYGSLAVAGIVLLLILLSYNLAVNGKRSALYFYIFGGLLFFIFNLNFFYPSYLSDKLVKEEAKSLNDTLQSYSNKISKFKNPDLVNNYLLLIDLKEKILSEIKYQNGFGVQAKKYLKEFNNILADYEKDSKRKEAVKITPSYAVGNSQEERDRMYNEMDKLLSRAIISFDLKSVASGKAENTTNLFDGIQQINELQNVYSPKLIDIIKDDFKIDLDSVKSHPHIVTLKTLSTEINNATDKINNAEDKNINNKEFARVESKSENIGKFEHTIASVKDRINRIDTWGIIFLCLFVDLLVPLFIYLMIRRNEKDEDNTDTTFWDNLTGKKKPTTF